MFEEERQIEMLATTLASSWDFYEHRLNLAKHGFSMIICQKHNASVPLFVLELDTQVMYEPGAVPDRRSVEEGKRKRRTPDEQKILISQIIIGASAGMTELKDMPDRTRQRYLVLREQFLQPKVGRPWAS